MPNEIYHRSEWGNPNPEGWGDIYFDPAATNKLYNHSDYYENSDGTDKILRDIPNKASITLTPTAYSDGSINTVIPPYQVLPQELVTNGDFSDGSTGWTSQSDVTFGDGTVSMNSTSLNAYINQNILTVGKKYRVSITVDALSITDKLDLINASGLIYKVLEVGTNNFDITATGNNAFRIRTKDGATSTISNVSVKEIQEADFDFSRGSSATRVNEKGLIEDVQILSGELVQNGDFEEIGSELITNGNFSDGLTGWNDNATYPVDYLNVVDDRLEFENINGNTQVFTSDSFSVTANKIYKISLDTIKESGADDFDITLRNTPLSTAVEIITTTHQTGELIYYFKSSSTQSLVFQFTLRDTIKGSIDNVSVKEVGQNWNFTGDVTVVDNGAKFNNTSVYSEIRQDNAITPNSKIRLTITVENYIGGGIAFPQFGVADGNGDPNFNISSNGTYVFEGIFYSTHLLIKRTGNGTDLVVSNISVVEITDDTDIPRIDYTTGFGSWLLEPQSTNLIPYSEDFSNVAWEYGGDVAIESGYTAPDGSNTAYKVTGTSGALATNVSATSTQTRSIYAKTLSGTGTVQLCTHNSNTNNIFTITPQWQRFEINTTTSLTGVPFFYAVDFRGASTTLSEVILWGAQLEDLSYATSYIPTSGSAVTRAAETATNSGNADLINSTEGVLYAEISANENVSGRWISLSNGTTNERVSIAFQADDIRLYIKNTSGLIWDYTYTSANIFNHNKIGLKYKSGDYALWINGIEVSTSSNSNLPSGLNSLQFDSGGGSSNFYGNVKELAVFKEALTDAELESLTSWISFTEMATDLEYTVE
jgi:hypothetical protein